jgi:hypothetical protein
MPYEAADLLLLEQHLHALIRERAGRLIAEPGLTLPVIAEPLPVKSDAAWFPVPGMYGGFCYWTVGNEDDPQLMCESWSRIHEGSGQRHLVSCEGTLLVDEGFV